MTYVGIDLAWRPRNRTGLAVLSSEGALVQSAVARSDDEIAAWLASHAADVEVAAVDAPIIVPNPTGQRIAERDIGRAYGRFGASAYPANRANPMFDPPRAAELARHMGWAVDPDQVVGAGTPVCIEVYPHPALVGLFKLPQRLAYKKGSDRQPGFQALADCLESVPELRLSTSSRWSELRSIIHRPGPGDLTRIEDEIDAILCAHLAWLWHHRPSALHVYGSFELGYIVAPPPPTHDSDLVRRPARPTPEVVDDASVPVAFVLEVRGDAPASGGFAGAAWEAAVADALHDVEWDALVRPVRVEIDFVGAKDGAERLESLISSTLRSLRPVLDAALHDRSDMAAASIEQIVAMLRVAGPDDVVGARIVVRPSAGSHETGVV